MDPQGQGVACQHKGVGVSSLCIVPCVRQHGKHLLRCAWSDSASRNRTDSGIRFRLSFDHLQLFHDFSDGCETKTCLLLDGPIGLPFLRKTNHQRLFLGGGHISLNRRGATFVLLFRTVFVSRNKITQIEDYKECVKISKYSV